MTPGRREYDEPVREAPALINEDADQIRGNRMKAVLTELVESMKAHGHLELDPKVQARLNSVGTSNIDRMLAPVRRESSKAPDEEKG